MSLSQPSLFSSNLLLAQLTLLPHPEWTRALLLIGSLSLLSHHEWTCPLLLIGFKLIVVVGVIHIQQITYRTFKSQMEQK